MMAFLIPLCVVAAERGMRGDIAGLGLERKNEM